MYATLPLQLYKVSPLHVMLSRRFIVALCLFALIVTVSLSVKVWTVKNGHTTADDFPSAELGNFTPLEILKREAENENPEAQYNLAMCYLSGNGVHEDKTEAMMWLNKAAEKGHLQAAGVLIELRPPLGDRLEEILGPCRACNGSKLCLACEGSGWKTSENSLPEGYSLPKICESCRGFRQCLVCNGSGLRSTGLP